MAEPKLYNREKDQVELDKYITRAKTGFDNWLLRIKGTKDQKSQIRKAYEEMLAEIEKGNVTVNTEKERSFSDSRGIFKNSKDGDFDAYGSAAAYLGTTLRSMDPYNKPQTSSKKSSNIFRDALNEYLLGSKDISNENLKYWTNRDQYNEEEKIRPTTERDKMMRSGLISVYNNWEDLIKDLSDDEKDNKRKELTRVLGTYNKDTDTFTGGILQDGRITPNEYAELYRLYGNGIERFFSTSGQEQEQQPLTEAQQRQQQNIDYRKGWNDYWLSLYDPSSVQLYDDAILDNTGSSIDFSNRNNDELYDTLQILLSGNDNPYSNYLSLPQAIYQYLNKLKGSNYLIDLGNNQYYIANKDDESNKSGYVWDSKANKLRHLYYLDIPYYQKKAYSDYYNKHFLDDMDELAYQVMYQYHPRQVQQNKNGGILKASKGSILKGQGGLSFLDALNYTEEDLKDDKRISHLFNKELNKFEFSPRSNRNATDLTSPDNGKYDPEGNATFESEQYYKDWLTKLTTDQNLAEAWARRYKSLNPTSGRQYSTWFNSDDTFNFDNFKVAVQNGDKRVYDDSVNGIGHDYYKGRVYQIVGDDGKAIDDKYHKTLLDGYELLKETDNSNPLATIYKMRKKQTGNTTGTTPDDKPTVVKETTSDVEEVAPDVDIPDMPTPSEFQLKQIGSDLLGLGRFMDAIRTNQKNEDILIKGIRPVLKNPWYVQTPIRGDLRGQQSLNSQGSSAISELDQARTSDAALALAGKSKSFEVNNEAVEKGYNIYDREWQRTKEVSSANNKEGVKNRAITSNENINTINKARQNIAQIQASKNLMDKSARDRLSLDIQDRINNRIEEEKAWKTKEIENIANQRYQAELEQLESSMQNYRLSHPNTYTTDENYINAVKRKSYLKSRAANDAMIALSKLNGYNWGDTYRDDEYEYFDWSEVLK